MLQRFTTVIAKAGTYNLVDLPTLKTELSIPTANTADDQWLTLAIQQISGAISRYCNRSGSEAGEASFPVETVQDLYYPERDAYPYQVPGGASILTLSHWPVSDIITLNTATDTPSGNTLNFGSADLTGISVGMPCNGLNLPASATVLSASAPNVQINGGNITADIPAGTPINFGISVAITDPPNSTPQAMVQGTDFVVDLSAGQLTKLDAFFAFPTIWFPVKTVVQYVSGYNPIPDDVVEAALRWITMRWGDRGREPGLKSIEQPMTGTKTYWVGGPPMSGGVPEEIASLLDKYRVPVAL